MSTIALPQVQDLSEFRISNTLGLRAVQIVLSLVIALGVIVGISLTSNAGTASAATGDSAPIYFGLGRAYTGENGLEIRLNRSGTELAYIAAGAFGAPEVEGTALATSATAALARFGPIMQQVIRSGGITTLAKGSSKFASGAAGWGAEKLIIPDGMCLGITYAPDTALLGTSTTTTGYAPTARQPYTASWLEPCS